MLTYGFFNAELGTNGKYDRVYSAEHFAEYFHLFVANGVFPQPATQLQVVASNTPDMNVNVKDGYGWINGYYAKNDGLYPIALQAASGTLNRIDAIVLRWVNATRVMELAVKTGTPAASPTVPGLQRDVEVYELMLATVTVIAGATNITQSSITDKRPDKSVCGWVANAVQDIDTTNLFAQYDTAFSEWFNNVKEQLSGNVATNLQKQIDELTSSLNTLNTAAVKVANKATTAQAQAGTDDTKWMTPLKTKQAIGTSGETVKDTTTGKISTIQSIPFYMKPLFTLMAPDNLNTLVVFGQRDEIFYVTQRGEIYELRNYSNKTGDVSATKIYTPPTTYTTAVLSLSTVAAVSGNGAMFSYKTGNVSYYNEGIFIPSSNKTMTSSIQSNLQKGVFVTNSYAGILHVTGTSQSTRAFRLTYRSRSASENVIDASGCSVMDIPSGNYGGGPKVVGAYSDYVFIYHNTDTSGSATKMSLTWVNLQSKSYGSYDFSSYTGMIAMGYTDRHIIFIKPSTCKKIVYDMSTHSVLYVSADGTSVENNSTFVRAIALNGSTAYSIVGDTLYTALVSDGSAAVPHKLGYVSAHSNLYLPSVDLSNEFVVDDMLINKKDYTSTRLIGDMVAKFVSVYDYGSTSYQFNSIKNNNNLLGIYSILSSPSRNVAAFFTNATNTDNTGLNNIQFSTISNLMRLALLN